MENTNREKFGSKVGVIAAAAGSAVGLGNIYRFPIVAGNNGGGAFLLIYLLILLFLGVSLIVAEFIIGRRAAKNAVGSFKKLAPKTAWPAVGFAGVVTAFAIITFYSTVSGWTLDYICRSVFDNIRGDNLEAMNANFNALINSSWRPYLCQALFIIMTAVIIILGVQKGIEKGSKIMMPILLVILLILLVRSLTLNGAGEGLTFFLKPDFSKINEKVIIDALGQVFFSLSIGMGTMITYGSYISKKDNLVSSAVSICICDTMVAFIAGMIIFPAAMAFGITPTAGPGLVFNTLPMLFGQMHGGYFFCLIFFVLLAIASITSLISLFEVVVAYLVEEHHFRRRNATLLTLTVSIVLGIFVTMSLNEHSTLKICGETLFDFLDMITANYFMTIGGLLVVLFVGWKMKKADTIDELSSGGTIRSLFNDLVYFVIKYVAPIAIIIIFVKKILD